MPTFAVLYHRLMNLIDVHLRVQHCGSAGCGCSLRWNDLLCLADAMCTPQLNLVPQERRGEGVQCEVGRASTKLYKGAVQRLAAQGPGWHVCYSWSLWFCAGSGCIQYPPCMQNTDGWNFSAVD